MRCPLQVEIPKEVVGPDQKVSEAPGQWSKTPDSFHLFPLLGMFLRHRRWVLGPCIILYCIYCSSFWRFDWVAPSIAGGGAREAGKGSRARAADPRGSRAVIFCRKATQVDPICWYLLANTGDVLRWLDEVVTCCYCIVFPAAMIYSRYCTLFLFQDMGGLRHLLQVPQPTEPEGSEEKAPQTWGHWLLARQYSIWKPIWATVFKKTCVVHCRLKSRRRL